jgi:DNA-binding CsgD family transcriptional regulator
MFQLPDSHARSVNKENSGNVNKNPLLINPQQWLYVQKLYELTPREREIAEMICQGYISSSIAKNLRIKTGTVKTHTRNIYRKVRVKSKIAMLLRFVSDVKRIAESY